MPNGAPLTPDNPNENTMRALASAERGVVKAEIERVSREGR